MPYIGQAPAPKVITSSDLSADVVTEAKIADNAVENEHLNANVITGHTALGATPADTDELLVSDAGTLKRVDFSYLKGGGMFEFISSTDVTSAVAQVDFTSFSTDYSDFKLVIQNLKIATDSQNPQIRYFNSDGNIFSGSYYFYQYQGMDSSSFSSASENNSFMRLAPGIGNATHESANIEITLYDVHATGSATIDKGYKTYNARTSFTNPSGLPGYADSTGFTKENNSDRWDISGVRFYLSSGNINSGRFSLYGRKHS